MFLIEAHVISNRIVPIQKFVKIIKQFSTFFVGMIQLLNFSIGLRTFDSGQDIFVIIFREKGVECALRITFFICLVCKELRTVIDDDLSDLSNIAIIL